MEIAINKKLIEKLKSDQASGQAGITVNQIKEVSKYLQSNKAKVIKIQDACYLVFAELPNIEFCITDFKKRNDLSFLDQKQLEYIDTSVFETGYTRFLLNEFLQGKGLGKIMRLFKTLAPLVLLNIAAYYFATPSSVQQTFAGLLMAVSVFVAIFSLFTVSHEYLQRKRLNLFEGGKLGYYFSVDKHITKTGVYSILIAIYGLLAAGQKGARNNTRIFNHSLNSIVLLVLLNLAFLGVFIILRSIVEFYITRPGKFMLGDLKKVSFKRFIEEIDNN